jgi:hydrogenase maturation protease
MKTLVLGLGNPILRDDSIGLRVVEEMRRKPARDPEVELDHDFWGGLRLMERMIGYDRVIVIDAILTGAEPGTIHFLAPGDIPTQRSASVHDVNLPTALELGRQAQAHLPASEDILLIGVEVEDVQTFDESLSPKLATALPLVVAAVEDAVKQGEVHHDFT